MGRPSSYTTAMGDLICERLAAGESLRAICKDDGMPCTSSVRRWLTSAEKSEGLDAFRSQYARAREAQADTLFDEILEIADEAKNDVIVDAQGVERTNQEVVARSRLRVDARKWMAGKLRPKVYGEKLALGQADDLEPLTIAIVADARSALHAKLLRDSEPPDTTGSV